jgi:curli biogenesis system outer membrane secretion channel CsgG
LGEGLAEMLVTELAKINKFQMLESTKLNALIDEINLGEAGFVAKEEKVDKGGFAGADFAFIGKVTRFGSKEQGVGLGGFATGGLGNLGVNRKKSDVRIDWRLVDIATRKILKTGSGEAEQTGMGFDIGVGVGGHGGNIGYQNKEFMNSALGRATVKALTNIVDQVSRLELPASGRKAQKETQVKVETAAIEARVKEVKSIAGKVVAVSGKNSIIVSLGSSHGVKAGDKLRLYRTEEIRDDKGEVMFAEEKEIGELVVVVAQDERSKARFDGSMEVKTGWIVRQK